MLTRKSLLTLALAVVAAPAVLAQTDAYWAGGDIGWTSRPLPGTLTRAEVQAQFQQFRANPVLADGTRVIGGEIGYVAAVPPSSVPRPAPIITAQERETFRQLYPQ